MNANGTIVNNDLNESAILIECLNQKLITRMEQVLNLDKCNFDNLDNDDIDDGNNDKDRKKESIQGLLSLVNRKETLRCYTSL